MTTTVSTFLQHSSFSLAYSILLSLWVFIPREVTLESSLIVAWFSRTNHDSFPRKTTITSNGFFRVCQNGRGGPKAGFRDMLKDFEIKKAFSMVVSLLYKTDRFHVVVRLFSTRSEKTWNCGKKISDTLGYCLVCHFFVLTTIWRQFVIYYWADARQHVIYLLIRLLLTIQGEMALLI